MTTVQYVVVVDTLGRPKGTIVTEDEMGAASTDFLLRHKLIERCKPQRKKKGPTDGGK